MANETTTAQRSMEQRADRLELAVEAARHAMEAIHDDYPGDVRESWGKAMMQETAFDRARSMAEAEAALHQETQEKIDQENDRANQYAAASPLVPTFEEGFGDGLVNAFYRAVFSEAYHWHLEQVTESYGSYVEADEPFYETPEALALAVTQNLEAHALGHWLTAA